MIHTLHSTYWTCSTPTMASRTSKQAGDELWRRTDKQVGVREIDSDLVFLFLRLSDLIYLDPLLYPRLRSISHLQNAELFTLTYGALVVQLIKDYEDYSQVNKQLDKMGFSIGTRIIEDFLAKSGSGRCKDLREVAEILAKVGRDNQNALLTCRPLTAKSIYTSFRNNQLIRFFVPTPTDRIQSFPKHNTDSSLPKSTRSNK